MSAAQNRIACVTGAAQGIGRAIALRLAEDGCDVAVGDLPREMASLKQLVDEIQLKGRKAVAISVDVTKEAEVDDFVSSTVKDLGGLDIMVANAGVATLGNILDSDIEELERVHAVNVKGTFLSYKAAAKVMIAQGRGGVIIGASSLAGKKGAGMCSVYGSSKFAVRAITQAAAMEWGKDHIRVNAYAPGATVTPLLADMDVLFGKLVGVPPNTYTDIVNIPSSSLSALGELVTPESIAGVVSFLASKDSGSMTGCQTLCADGGIWFD
ncbi:hypothetical protein B0H19DRAFT_930334 [Mycena capillaripes]|nr:hypothetical protein B0H19DRAFT_930334 [Mycena capillaripes]